MFSKAKNKTDKNGKKRSEADKKANLAQLGLLEIPDVSSVRLGADNGDDEEYDSDLEAELLALTQGKTPISKRNKTPNVGYNELDSMVAECMRDDVDEDILDEDDPELLAELAAFVGEDEAPSSVVEPVKTISNLKPIPVISGPAPMQAGPSLVQLLTERKALYEEAETNATTDGETSRARRFNRGLKTLNNMLKSAQAGKVVNEADIPPAIVVKSSRSNSSVDLNQSQSSSSLSEVSSPMSPALVLAPSTASLTSKEEPPSQRSSTDVPVPIRMAPAIPQPTLPNVPSEESVTPEALQKANCVEERQQEYKLAALKAKKEGDMERAISCLRIAKQLDPLISACREGRNVDLGSLPPPVPNYIAEAPPETAPVEREESTVQTSPDDPPAPTTPLEALEQRYGKYVEQMTKAKAEGNARKERMNKRIIKQYQQAITEVKAGRLVDFDELPCPPGFADVPVASVPAPPKAIIPPETPPKPRSSDGQSSPKQLKPSPDGTVPVPKANVRNAPKSRVERQLSVLQTRQNLFRDSALQAKKRGEIEQAKEYLRNCKGIEQLITATRSGLPVDMNTVPIPPQETLENFDKGSDFEVITKEDCQISPASMADSSLTYTKLENDLVEQIKMCARTREHFKALGDVASSNRFEQLILHSKKDLDAIRAAFKRGDSPPKFHYETRSFTMIQCNTELTDSDLELTVLRGINYNVPNPKEVDTYIKIEFPYPSDYPPQDKTEVVKDTNCPEYNHKSLFSIDRKSRTAVRVFKRHTIKCQVVCKGRWFHRDTPLGIIKIPLSPLENKCTLHESYDLIDEKKKMVGGKIEVKVRLRNPMLSKQLEKVTEKWLVIDGF